MLNENPDSMEQRILQEYLSGLRNVLKKGKKGLLAHTSEISQRDFLPFRKKIHYFADQCLEAKGEPKPFIDLQVNREHLDKFCDMANKSFRKKYSKLKAESVHAERQESKPKIVRKPN